MKMIVYLVQLGFVWIVLGFAANWLQFQYFSSILKIFKYIEETGKKADII